MLRPLAQLLEHRRIRRPFHIAPGATFGAQVAIGPDQLALVDGVARHAAHGLAFDDVEVHLHKKEVNDVKMKIQAYEEDFMIATAMQGDVEGLKVPGFTSLNLNADVMKYAEANLTEITKP